MKKKIDISFKDLNDENHGGYGKTIFYKKIDLDSGHILTLRGNEKITLGHMKNSKYVHCNGELEGQFDKDGNPTRYWKYKHYQGMFFKPYRRYFHIPIKQEWDPPLFNEGELLNGKYIINKEHNDFIDTLLSGKSYEEVRILGFQNCHSDYHMDNICQQYVPLYYLECYLDKNVDGNYDISSGYIIDFTFEGENYNIKYNKLIISEHSINNNKRIDN